MPKWPAPTKPMKYVYIVRTADIPVRPVSCIPPACGLEYPVTNTTPRRDIQMFRSLLLSSLVSVVLAPAAFALSVDEVSAQVKAAWESHKSMRAVLRVEAAVPTGSGRVVSFGDGTIVMQRGAEGERYKGAAKIGFVPPMSATMQLESVYDGKSLKMRNDALGRKSTRDVGSGVLQGVVPPGGALLLEALSHDAVLDRVEEGRLESVDAYIFEGRANSGEGGSPQVSRLRAFIAKETGALLKLELYETDTVMTAHILLRDFEWDVELEAGDLEFSALEIPAAK